MDGAVDTLSPGEKRELAGRLYAAWNSGGAAAVAAEFWDDEIVWRDPPEFPDSRTVRGRAEAEPHVAAITEGLGDFKFEMLEVLPFEGGAVVEVRIVSSGPSSGVPIDAVGYHVAWIRDGRMTEVRVYLSRDQALAAAGLSG